MLKMKDGRTHPGYKAEHVVDLKTEEVVSARVCEGTAADSETLAESEVCAPADLIKAGSETEIKEVAADKGDHANNTLVE